MGATNHFVRRAMERVGCSAEEANILADNLILAIQTGRDDMAEFVSRVDKQGCRLFRFRSADGRSFFAMVNTDDMACVTVMPAGFTVSRQGKGALKLRERDL
jgi:hypothetical protein